MLLKKYSPNDDFIKDLWIDYWTFSMKISILGQWKEVVSPQIDRTSEKNVKNIQGKEPKILFDLINNLELVMYRDIKIVTQKNILIFPRNMDYFQE